ncbi:pilus assembly protein N-terminal domain-containing protein [Xylophilus sp. GW821-FHT01B05]
MHRLLALSRPSLFLHTCVGALLAGTAALGPVPAAAQTERATDSAAQQRPVIELYQGEVRALDVQGTIKRIAIGNGSLVSSTITAGRLLLLAEAAGTTSLVVWTENGIALQAKLRVTPTDLQETLSYVRGALADVPGLRIQQQGGKVVLTGMVHEEQLAYVRTVAQRSEDIVNLVRADEGAAPRKTIHFKLQIMEITKRGQENIGIQWDQSINGPQASIAGNAIRTGRYRTLPSSDAASFDNTPGSVNGRSSGAYLGIATSIFSRINIAISDGDAFLLAAPELNSRSGGAATFLAGGEVPIPRAGAFGTTDVTYKPYGIRLNINPTVDSRGNIAAGLETEISQIDPSITYGGFPAFLTRRTTSDLSLRAGETIALSGLVSADSSRAIDKVPLLGDVPVLGRLFRSDAFRSNKSDLVIFVTPMLVDPQAPATETLLDRAGQIDQGYRHDNGDPSPLPALKARREQEDAEQAARSRSGAPSAAPATTPPASAEALPPGTALDPAPPRE